MDIERKIEQVLKKLVTKQQELLGNELLSTDISEKIELSSPKSRRFGDFSTNAALIIAQSTERAPLEIAASLKDDLCRELKALNLLKNFTQIEIKEPGFINFFLSDICLYEILLEIRRKQDSFGRQNLGNGRKVLIEFVSANPTGPLNVAHARQAAFGDSLANLLQFLGYKVSREYYLNDEGVQIDILGESLCAKYLELLGISVQFPSSGYRGRYLDELARRFLKKYGRRFAKNSQRRLSAFTHFAYTQILKTIKQDLNLFGVNFDCWFSQKSLGKTAKIAKALELLKKKSFLYQKDGAWWLATRKFGDDKDRVVIKSDSKLTYIAADIAYHRNKFQRGYDKMINIWGPDHHGYIARLKAAIEALGYDAKQLIILIVQLVSLTSADKLIPMSTRLGQYVSLHDIIQAVGRDAARFFFLMRKRSSHLNFDLELAQKQSLENPVYYIQYAHARILNILEFAKNSLKDFSICKKLKLSLLNNPEEMSLIQQLRKFPSILASCALNLEPHRITAYLQDLAKDFHHYYEKHRVVTEDFNLSSARLTLIDAVRIVLNNGLGLLGISTPKQM